MFRRAAQASAALAAVVLVLTACAAGVRDEARHVVLERDPVPAGSVVGFYGDSLTAGFGASSPSRRWSTLLCAERGWTEVNPSISGLGFVKARTGTDLVGAITAAAPRLVIVALGHNDLLLVDGRGAEVEAAIR